MTLLLHHLHMSQSERIVWLLEELNIPYTLHTYNRAPLLAPRELKNVPGNTLGTAPVLQDGDNDSKLPTVTLCESGAIVEYVLAKYCADSRLAVHPSHDSYQHYLYWFHAANSTLQSRISGDMFLKIAGVTGDNPAWRAGQDRLQKILGKMDARVAETGA